MNLSNIIISDLVPLSQRGLYQGLIGLTFALASAIGPPLVRHLTTSIMKPNQDEFSLREVLWLRRLLGDGSFVSLIKVLSMSEYFVLKQVGFLFRHQFTIDRDRFCPCHLLP